MRYELLGTLRALDGDRPRQIRARKIELLLAVLLINTGRVVTTDELVMEIWGESPPRRATAGLHVYVSELRKFLDRPGSGGNLIVTRSPGYVLSLPEDDALDFREFHRLSDQGRAAGREHRPDQAADLLERALALWRGPVLGGPAPGPIVRGFATWATDLRMESTELLVDAHLELGRHRELVGRLLSLTTEHPLYEPFHRQLMLALYRSDRRADALRAYQDVRTTLIDELGVEPCRPLRELHQAILGGDGDRGPRVAARSAHSHVRRTALEAVPRG